MDVAGRVREGIGREEELPYNMRRANHQMGEIVISKAMVIMACT